MSPDGKPMGEPCRLYEFVSIVPRSTFWRASRPRAGFFRCIMHVSPPSSDGRNAAKSDFRSDTSASPPWRAPPRGRRRQPAHDAMQPTWTRSTAHPFSLRRMRLAEASGITQLGATHTSFRGACSQLPPLDVS